MTRPSDKLWLIGSHPVSNYGKGTKKAPGWFYGFSGDMWQAYALGVTYIDLGDNKK